MKLNVLKANLTELTQQLDSSYVSPTDFLKALQKEHSSILPEKLQEAFNNYQIAYNKLRGSYKKIQAKIDEETKKGTDNNKEIGFKEEMEGAHFLHSSFQRTHVDLQLAQNLAYKEKHQQTAFYSDQKSEKIVLAPEDFSETCVTTVKAKIDQILDSTSGLSSVKQMSKKLETIGHDPLNEEGISNGHFTDYPRRSYVFLNNNLPKLKNPTGAPINDDLETVVQAYLTHYKLDQKVAPNIRAMITTLSYQSGLAGIGEILLRSGFIGEKFDFKGLAARATVFFNQETGKLQLEMFMEKGILNLESQEIIESAKVSEKITVDIDVKKDTQGYPQLDTQGYPKFVAGDPKISISIVRPINFAETHPMRIKETTLKDLGQVNEQNIDNLHPFLEDLVKFGGYPSLEAVYYSEPTAKKTEEFQRLSAKRNVELVNFNDDFIRYLKALKPDEEAFLKKLSNDYYIKGKSKSSIGKEIFQFVERQLNSEISQPDKLRYVHLLKIEAALSKTNSQDFVEKISRWNNKEILVEAAKNDKSVYQEIVEPKLTFSYIFRKIGESFGIVKPRPEFTIHDHLAVLKSHPDLLDDTNKNNPYRVILQKVSPEESFDYKLSLLSTYMNDPTKNPRDLGEPFFLALNQEICTVLQEANNEEKYLTVRKHLDKWLLEGDADKVEWLRSYSPLKAAFTESLKGFAASSESVEYRLELLITGKGIKENTTRFGADWLDRLRTDLATLGASGKLDANSPIINIITRTEALYYGWRNYPELNPIFALIPVPPVPGVSPKIVTSEVKEDHQSSQKKSFSNVLQLEERAKMMTDDVNAANNDVKKSVESALKHGELAAKKPYPISAPIDIPSSNPHP